MNWIKILPNIFKMLSRKINQIDSQQKLILLVCIPCFIVTSTALFIAGTSGYLIAFIMILLALLCTFVAISSKYHSEHQIRTFSNLIESMIDGDYTLRARKQNNHALQDLLNLINDLADNLASHKIEAKESRLLLERIMAQMDAMVIATNEQGYVVMANAAAKKLILPKIECITDIKLNDIAVGAQIIESSAGIVAFNHTKLSGEHFLFKDNFLSSGTQHTLYMLTNAERLLMEKERQAWQSLLRVLSHEMNNSLAPIIAISQSMKKKLQQTHTELKADSLLAGVGIINERADSLSGFIASYSQLSHLPKPNKSLISLSILIEKLALLFPEAQIQHNIDALLMIDVDKGQFEQVLINLLKNATEAMKDQQEKLITVNIEKSTQWLHILIKDTGAGISNLDNLFVPFYTTKSQGSGIGLALCRQIMFNHNAMIKLQNADKQGAVATLSLPVKTS